MIHPVDDRVKAFPFLADFKNYSSEKFFKDMQAAVTVVVFAVPQAMAYAILAGVPPFHGLCAAIILSIVAALWGSSAFVNTGPTNSAALLTAAALLPHTHSHSILELVFLFTLLVGIMRLVMGILRLGTLVEFIPQPAFIGFTTGAAVLIATSQLHHLFGIPAPGVSTFFPKIKSIVDQLPAAKINPLIIGSFTLILMLLLNRFARRWPVALGIIFLASVVVEYLKLEDVKLVRDISAVPSSFPVFHIPEWNWSVMEQMIPAALAVALLGLMEAVSIGQRLALKRGDHLNFNQEFFGQGLSHVVGAFFQCIPGSGSFTRSALIEQTGGSTRFANVFFGLISLLVVFTFSGVLNRIPIATLAGLLIYIGIKLIDVRQILRVLETSRSDFLVMAITFAITVFYRIELGIFAGLIVSTVFFLQRVRSLRIFELVPKSGQNFEERPYTPESRHDPSDLVVLSVNGELSFPVAYELRNQLNEIVTCQKPKHLILRTRRANSIDYSCWTALFEFAEGFHKTGGKLYVCGVKPEFAETIKKAGMGHLIPPGQIFAEGKSLFQSLKECISSISGELPSDANLSEAWKSYLGFGVHL